jgi:hypothetical protein
MNRQEVLKNAADTFLQNTNVVYAECSEGIARLDRIIVSVHAGLAGWARTSQYLPDPVSLRLLGAILCCFVRGIFASVVCSRSSL